MTNYAIIGFGCAGYYAAKAIREKDPEGRITVFSEHGYAPYNPMLTTYYAAGRIPFEALFPFGSMEQIQKELDLKIFTETKVAKLLAKEKTVVLENGETHSFDQILVASGARAFAPSFEGLDPADAFCMRTVDDAIALKEAVDSGRYHSALVVGASMVGIKVVELLNNKGIAVTLADMAPKMFPLAAYDSVAEEIARRIEAKGVKLALGNALKSASKKENGYDCIMADGSRLFADLIVLCIGTRTNLAFIDPQEIRVNRGIVVDDNMKTSCEGIYAAGDCCEGHELQSSNSMIIGLWANAAHQGSTAGYSMTGTEAAFDGNFLHNITHFMDMDFIGFGDNRIKGRVITSGDIHSGLYVEAVLDENGLCGVNILDNYRISGAVKNYLYRILDKKTAQISPIQKGILIKEGLRPSFIEKMEGSYHE
ncbi:MAG: FAD-dependent oxidoreductase [Firmicutes bacterium]|nr:FAD-dependent oxidoreductase [Bacillota bacterium]